MDLLHITAPFVGGLALEASRWFQLRERLSSEKYRSMLKSPLYWAVTLAMIAFGAMVAIYWGVSKDEIPTSFELLVAGAAAPSLLSNGISALLSKETTRLGSDDAEPKNRVRFRDLFIPEKQ